MSFGLEKAVQHVERAAQIARQAQAQAARQAHRERSDALPDPSIDPAAGTRLCHVCGAPIGDLIELDDEGYLCPSHVLARQESARYARALRGRRWLTPALAVTAAFFGWAGRGLRPAVDLRGQVGTMFVLLMLLALAGVTLVRGVQQARQPLPAGSLSQIQLAGEAEAMWLRVLGGGAALAGAVSAGGLLVRLLGF